MGDVKTRDSTASLAGTVWKFLAWAKALELFLNERRWFSIAGQMSPWPPRVSRAEDGRLVLDGKYRGLPGRHQSGWASSPGRSPRRARYFEKDGVTDTRPFLCVSPWEDDCERCSLALALLQIDQTLDTSPSAKQISTSMSWRSVRRD